MAVLGADPVELREIGRELRNSRDGISAARKRLGPRVRSSDWHGSDARQFIALWRRHEADLAVAVALLDQASAELDRNALEQEDASSARSAAGPVADVAGGARHPDRGGLPVRTTRVWADAALAVALGVTTGTAISIDFMADGSAVVWMADSGGLNGEAGVGATLGAERVGLEASAGAGVSASAITTKGWIVEAEDVEDLTKDLLAERGSDLVGKGLDMLLGGSALGPFWALSGTGPGSEAAGTIEDIAGFGLGEPDFVEASLGLNADAGLGLSAGIPLAGIGVLGATSLAIRRGPGGESLIISGRGGLDAEAVGKHHDTVAESRVEVPLGSEGPVDVKVTTTTTVGRQHTLSVDTYRIAESEIHGAMSAATSGDIPGAADEVLDILESFDEPTESLEAHGYGERRSLEGLGGDVKVGAKGEARVGVGMETIDYGPDAAPPVRPDGSSGGGGSW